MRFSNFSTGGEPYHPPRNAGWFAVRNGEDARASSRSMVLEAYLCCTFNAHTTKQGQYSERHFPFGISFYGKRRRRIRNSRVISIRGLHRVKPGTSSLPPLAILKLHKARWGCAVPIRTIGTSGGKPLLADFSKPNANFQASEVSSSARLLRTVGLPDTYDLRPLR